MILSSAEQNKTVSPFLKWAGGKRWLVNSAKSLFPEKLNKYFEPFLGSAAVYFALKPQYAVLSDVNAELIECYAAIKNDWQAVERLVNVHHQQHSKEYYYQVRSIRPETPAARAARFIYLNRTCWNGLYRVNLKGQFNVPIGTKKNAVLDTDNFEGVSKLLKNVELVSQDFEEVIDQAKTGDFIFADPPYTVKHNFNGFVKYNETMFHWDDQVRLSESIKRASARGCLVMVTNANHPSVRELYEDCFTILPIERSSVIAASSANRGIYQEIIIRNYSRN